MPLYLLITIIGLGIILLLVEFLVMPGINIAGVAGTVFIVGGLIGIYLFRNVREGNIVTLISLPVIVGIFVLAFKSGTWSRLSLKTEITGHSADDVTETIKAGDRGKTVSKLSPEEQCLLTINLLKPVQWEVISIPTHKLLLSVQKRTNYLLNH